MTGEGKHCTESEGAGMKTYIERAAVHELVKRIPRYEMFNYDRTESLTGINPDDVDFGVDKIPAAPVVEVRRGRWLKRSDGTPYCSNCGANERDTYSSVVNECAFCYSCGARIDKEDEQRENMAKRARERFGFQKNGETL